MPSRLPKSSCDKEGMQNSRKELAANCTKRDAFLFTIFPDLVGRDNDQIISKLEKLYTYGPYKPKVSISNDWVIREIDTPTILSQETDYRKTVALCEKRGQCGI